MTDWTPRMIDKLERGVKAGKTYTQIAREIGNGMSKNGCISKAHRLGIFKGKENAVYVVGHGGEGIFYHENRERAISTALSRLNERHGRRALTFEGTPRFGREEVESMMHRVLVKDLAQWRFE